MDDSDVGDPGDSSGLQIPFQSDDGSIDGDPMASLWEVADSMSDVLLAVTPEGRIEEANAAVSDVLGHDPSSLEGRDLGSLLVPDDRGDSEHPGPGQSGLVDRVCSDDGVADLDVTVRTADGGRLPMELTSSVVPGDGTRAGVVCVAVPAGEVTPRGPSEEGTDRRESEIESDDRYRALFERHGIVLWEFDLSAGKRRAEALADETDDLAAYLNDHPEKHQEILEAVEVTDVNERAVEFYDADSKAELESSLDEVVTEDSLNTWRRLWQTVVDGGTTLRSECTARTLDGEVRTVLLEMTVPDAYADDYSCVYLTALDVTDRVERRQRFDAFTEAFPDLGFIIDEDGQYIDVLTSPASEELLNNEPEEIIGENIRDFFSPDQADELLALFETTLDTGQSQTLEYRVEVERGNQWFEGRTVPFGATVDGKRAVTWVTRDVTERKQRERELRRKNEFLDEFAGVVSHDITTPIGVIENKARLVEMTGDPSHAEDIYDACERVRGMIDELQDLAQEGKQVGETSRLDFEAVVREAWDSVEAPAATMTVESSADLHASRDRLRQLLENLLRNAVAHGRDESDSETTDGVEVRTGGLPDGFYVADDGPGIPESEREKVFEQGFSTTEGGTGLGLAIVQRIVEGHGWSVEVLESEEGGARFEVRTGE